MSVLIPIEISANYDKDKALFDKLNKHLDISYLEETDQISFNFDYGEEGHYVTIAVSFSDLIEAIGKAKKLTEQTE